VKQKMHAFMAPSVRGGARSLFLWSSLDRLCIICFVIIVITGLFCALLGCDNICLALSSLSSGKLPFFGARRYNRRRLNVGNLLSHSRNGVGFHQLTTLDNDFNDELDPLRSDDSDIEEFSSIALHQRPA